MKTDRIILNANVPGFEKLMRGYVKSFVGKGNITVEITVLRDQRTLSMNAWWHGVAFPHIARRLSELDGYMVTMYEAKQRMKDKFLRREIVNPSTGEATGVFETKGTHELDRAEAAWFSERLCEHAMQDLDDPIPERAMYDNSDAAMANQT